ncbi:MAG TPA: M14 family zinc carboxypeptidase [Xanthobacteraceae bacterium]
MPPPAGYLTSAAIEGVLALLNAAYPAFTQLVQTPEASVEQRVIRALRIRGGASTGDRNGVLLVGGHHARELINPDALVGLAYQLCWAYDNGIGITLGPTFWSANTVRSLVEGLDIFILPNVNPDGREFVRASVQAQDQWWRKNRSVNADGTRGTDLNRNYDFLWQWIIGQTSNVPGSETYHGSAAFSEPETRNVRWMFDHFPNIIGYVDVHSYAELVLYPWGDDDDQNVNATQNFLNPVWNGLRGASGGYGEYIPAADQAKFQNMGNAMRDAIAAVRGRTYTVEQGFALYGTTGISSDYAYSRFFTPGGKRKIWGFGIETNHGANQAEGFQPDYATALEVSKEIQSGLIQFMFDCLCVVQEVGKSLIGPEALDALRHFRDVEMMESPRGRQWANLLDLHGREVLLLLLKDPTAWKAAGQILSAGAAVVTGRDSASPATIGRTLVTQMQRLATQLEKRASPPLKKALTDARKDLGKMTGKTARQVLR